MGGTTGPLTEPELRGLVEQGRSVREIARTVGRSPTAVRHWLRKYGLTSKPGHAAGEQKSRGVMRECRTHGVTEFRPVGATGTYRCCACNTARVTARRWKVKEILVREGGGGCALCGYSRYVGALHFHHRDPQAKGSRSAVAA